MADKRDNIRSLTPNAPIPGRETEPVAEIVLTLEGMLSDARQGRIRHLAAIPLFHGTGYMTVSVGEAEPLRVLGAIGILYRRVQDATQVQVEEIRR